MNTRLTEVCKYLKLEPQYLKLLSERDTSDVWRQIAIWNLVDPADGVRRFTKPNSEQYDAISYVAQLYIDGCKDIRIWKTAGAKAAFATAFPDTYYTAKAAFSFARAAAYNEYAIYAAYDYAVAVENSANSDNDDAIYAAAYAAAKDNMADKLLELINAAPSNSKIVLGLEPK